jgi:hypothetical protein
MSTTANKLATPLAPLLARLELDDEGAALLADIPEATAAVGLLAEAGRMADALRLVAHALPKREAVWLACMCARGVPDLAPNPLDAAALTAAELWVRKPEEASRRAAMTAAQASGCRSPEAWAAVGAFWSGGSMAPEGQPEVPPADNLTGVAVAGALLLASARHAPERGPARLERFLVAARDIAAGGAGRLAPEEP